MFTVISLADWRSTKLAINAQLQPVLQRSGYLWFNEDNTPRHRLIAKMSSSPTEVYLNNYLTLLKQFSDFGWTPSKLFHKTCSVANFFKKHPKLWLFFLLKPKSETPYNIASPLKNFLLKGHYECNCCTSTSLLLLIDGIHI